MMPVLMQIAPWMIGVLIVVIIVAFIQAVMLVPPERRRGDAIADMEELEKLVGQVGRVLTPMRPVGTCAFDGRKVECVAENGYVQRDETVEVIRVAGTQVVVRVMDEA